MKSQVGSGLTFFVPPRPARAIPRARSGCSPQRITGSSKRRPAFAPAYYVYAMKAFFTWLDERRDLGVLLLRLFVGIRLVYGVVDNVLDWQRMLEFRDFLENFNFPWPLASAVVSVYAQLIAGILIVLGWKIRYAALLMIVNFLVALAMVHRGDRFEAMTPALAMLFASVLFLFQGPGRYAVRGE
jgi:putative oxidoreductase